MRASGHPREREFGLYVSGLMDDREQATFEAHVGDCPACQAQLQREAELEVLLLEVAQQPEPVGIAPKPPIHRAERWGRAACGALATAAAVLLTLSHPTQWVEIGASPASVAEQAVADAPSLDTQETSCAPADGPACAMDSMMALATYPPEGLETGDDAGSCWLDEHGIDPRCVSSDPTYL